MQGNKKIFAVITILSLVMIIAVISLGFQEIEERNKEISILEEQLENKNNQRNDLEEAYKEKLKNLENTVQKIEKEKDEKEESLNSIIDDLGIDNMTDEQVKKIGDISSNTPLNLRTSAILVKVANKYELNPSLILSIMELESNFKKYEVGAAQDRGYMQIIPATEKWLVEEFDEMHNLTYDPTKIFEPEYNIELAATYLHLLKSAYGENYSRILSEYNRGPYNLAKYYEEHKTYSTSYSKVILEKEQKYLAFN